LTRTAKVLSKSTADDVSDALSCFPVDGTDGTFAIHGLAETFLVAGVDSFDDDVVDLSFPGLRY
jgi:hypothetical protein